MSVCLNISLSPKSFKERKFSNTNVQFNDDPMLITYAAQVNIPDKLDEPAAGEAGVTVTFPVTPEEVFDYLFIDLIIDYLVFI